MLQSISSFDNSISELSKNLDMKGIKSELEKINKNMEPNKGKWRFDIVRNVGGYMTSVTAEKI
jgi:hypothetical protein